MLKLMPILDSLSAGEHGAIRNAVAGAVETMLVRSGEFGAGLVTQDAADDVLRATRAAGDAARVMNLEAYAARAKEGKSVTGGLDSVAIKVDGLPHVPDAAGQKVELAQLHELAQSRTPENNVRALVIGKIGNGIAWDEYVRLFEDERGVTAANAVRAQLDQTIEMTVDISERLKTTNPRIRPYNVDPSLTTVVHRPDSLSYPSGHTARAEAASLILQHHWPERADEFKLLSKWVGDSRLYGGVHFPSDVAAGRELGRRIAGHILENSPSPTVMH